MIREQDRPTLPIATHRVARLPRIDPRTLDLLFVAARFIVCLAAIWMGMVIAVNSPNDAYAAAAALACAGMIYGCLGRS